MRNTPFLASSIIHLSGLAAQYQEQRFELIAPDHWADFKIEHKSYPRLAGLAGIQGQVMLSIFIKPDGSILKIRAISGPPQLRSYAESLLDSMFSQSCQQLHKGPGCFLLQPNSSFTTNQ